MLFDFVDKAGAHVEFLPRGVTVSKIRGKEGANLRTHDVF